MVPRPRAPHGHFVTVGHVCCVLLPPRFAWRPPRASETQFHRACLTCWAFQRGAPGVGSDVRHAPVAASRLPACRRAPRNCPETLEVSKKKLGCPVATHWNGWWCEGLQTLDRAKTWLGSDFFGAAISRPDGSGSISGNCAREARLWQDASRSGWERFAARSALKRVF